MWESIAIQTFEIQHTSNFNFEASIFNFEASILIYQVLHLFRSWQCQTYVTRGGKVTSVTPLSGGFQPAVNVKITTFATLVINSRRRSVQTA